MEHAVHEGPFLAGGGGGVAALHCRDVGLPLGLARQCGESGHGGFDVKVGHGLHNHEYAVAVYVHFHLEDADLTYSLAYLGPVLCARVALYVRVDDGRIVG